jgi:hypothetical protein
MGITRRVVGHRNQGRGGGTALRGSAPVDCTAVEELQRLAWLSGDAPRVGADCCLLSLQTRTGARYE